MRRLFIINPVAGKADSTERLVKAAHEAFDAGNEKIEICRTRCSGHAAEAAREAAESKEETVIYACGGDGTLNEVASGMIGSDTCILAPVPIGSGNDFVRAFGENTLCLFSDPAELVDRIESRIDVMTVNGRACLNIASTGFDAEVCRKMPIYRRLPGVSGEAAYNLALVHEFIAGKKTKLSFEIDGERLPERDYLFAVAANGQYYGGGYRAAPYARMSDGLIDVILVPSIPRISLVTMVGSYRRGEHLGKYGFVRFTRCRSIRYISEEPIIMNVDGEMFEMESPTVSLLPKALRIMLPRSLADKK